jgi:hypothetical protein
MAVTASAISGPYYGSYNGTYIGATEDGFEIEHTLYSEAVRGDNLGDSIQDEIHRGCDVYVNFTLIEYNKGRAAAAGAGSSKIDWTQAAEGVAGVIGDVISDASAALVLTALGNTPAAASPASITFTKSILARNFPVRVIYASRLRRLPLRLISYPDGSGSSQAASYNEAIKWYTTT